MTDNSDQGTKKQINPGKKSKIHASKILKKADPSVGSIPFSIDAFAAILREGLRPRVQGNPKFKIG
ncbi:hypothetical protein B4U84_27240 [Westiellopsis prolifica IICB1]|nr:hypothetical protein B4U84_27240 [Westiellopsis prolifica IICB1]